MKENSFRSFLSGTKKNTKDCMTITLWSGKELGNEKGLGNSKNVVNRKTDNEKIVDENVANKRVEDKSVEVKGQESQVGKKEENREKN